MSAPASTVPLTIAIIKPCCIGDCVMALPAIESLASAFPFAHIHAFTGRHSAAVFRASKHISRVYLTPDQFTGGRAAALAWNLRTAGHDWVVVLDRSRWLLAAARSARPPRLVTLPRVKGSTVHETDVYLAALENVGLKPATNVSRMEPDEDSRLAAIEVLNGLDRPFAVLHPGGAKNPGATMTGKRWPVERYASVMHHLAKRGIRTVLTGSEAEAELCRQLAVEAETGSCLNLAGEVSLMTSVAVVEQAAVYLGADTGMSHLAAAVGTPAVVIFGPTNPRRYAPRGNKVVILAPDESNRLADTDLRKAKAAASLPRTTAVSVDDAVNAIEGLIETGTGH